MSEPKEGPVWVVTDLTEENFVEISVPRIYGGDRSRYVARQLLARFPETRYRIALKARSTGSLMERLAPPVQTLTAVEPADRINTALAKVTNPIAGVWSTSMLLARMGSKLRMPPNLLIVLAQPTGMRIVFLKDRSPILTRMVVATSLAADQAVEILRTVRHLENTKVIARGAQRFSVLLLGAAEGLAPLLAADRLDELSASIIPKAKPGQDWRHVLFDVVCKNPFGQMAPMDIRTTYLALQTGKVARVVAGLCLLVSGALAIGSLVDIIHNQRDRNAVQASALLANQQLAEVDTAIEAFGVAPDLLRKALKLDHDEIASAPNMQADWVALSRVMSSVVGTRLKTLQWRVLAPNDVPCVQVGQTNAVDAAPAPSDDPATPSRAVELQITVALTQDAGPRLRLEQATAITEQLGKMPGAKVLGDPARRMREGDISASSAPGSSSDAAPDISWCATLPGTAQTSNSIP